MLTRVKVSARENPRMYPPGVSPLAITASQTFAGKQRPKGWQGKVYGGVTHTTGRGLPNKAEKDGVYVTVTAARIYSRSRGCNYAMGYRGHQGGDLIQIANENTEAWGVGVGEPKNKSYKGQVESIKRKYKGSWQKDLPPSLVKRWQERWPLYSNPLDLLPGTKTANAAYVQMELIPLTKYWINQGYEPHDGTLFTFDQHISLAHWYVDVAERNGWEGEWWRTPRVLGHEDLTPITRHDKRGGWDPGWLRSSVYFDWEPVIEEIVRLEQNLTEQAIVPFYHQTKEPRPDDKKPGYYGRFK